MHIMFFMYNLTVPFFFIESLYKIALVVFLFPLFLMAYALDKKSFVRSGLDTFLSAVFQIISLSIMCSVVALLMNYISTLDFYGLQSAIEKVFNKQFNNASIARDAIDKYSPQKHLSSILKCYGND